MALTDAEKVQIRFYLGYPSFGNTPVPNNSWRYSEQYGDLEFRMINLSDDEIAEVRVYYLPNLLLLKNDVPATRENVDTSQAAVWYRNPKELAERWALYNSIRKALAAFIGAEIGPYFQYTTNSLRLAL